jgi:hypothetical protein
MIRESLGQRGAPVSTSPALFATIFQIDPNVQASALGRRQSAYHLAHHHLERAQASGRALWFYPTIGVAIAVGVPCSSTRPG